MTEGNPRFQIRAATEDDLPSVLSLYRRAGLDGDDVLPLCDAKILFKRIFNYQDYTLFVSNEKEEIVGTYALLIMVNLAHRGTPSAIVEDVAVDPEKQGLGIGKAMISHAMQISRERGCYKLVLSSNKKRQQAHQFYESIGFERHGFSFQVFP